MSILDELEKNNNNHRVATTLLAVNEHPALCLDDCVREAYFKCICFICYADKIYHDLEIPILEDLAKSISISSELVDRAKIFAVEANSDEIEKIIRDVKKANIHFSCIMDMFVLSYSDGQLCKKEDHYISVFANRWNVGSEVLEKLKKLSHAVYNGKIQDAVNYLGSFADVFGDQRGNIRQWLEAVLGSSLDGEESVVINKKVESEGESIDSIVDSNLVSSLQREISSQFGKLKKLLTDVGSGSNDSDHLEILNQIEEERQKVKDLRLTLAFVGTMKAGKSTAINAVIGANVLPNRSGAMTTMPTLVTHVPGRIEPILRFRKNQPFTKAIETIRSLPKDTVLASAKGANHEETLHKIINGNIKRIESTYESRQGIYDFMLIVNDVARICAELGIETPLEHYSSISDFPEIEVEFSYLADRVKQSPGRLTLIDTPGPNEAGQGHLKGVVKEQLAKASAIVCVVDPTQADSEAQAEIREWLQGAQRKSGAELFVLVNKIDTVKKSERQRELFEAKALRLFPDFTDAAGTLKSIRGKVYGVSSQQALLSNMVSRAIAMQSRLSHWDDEPWVADFMEKAYGTYWEDVSIDDIQNHLEQGDRMWANSGMQSPMDKLVASSLSQVVPLCFGTALRTVATHAENLKQESRVRWKALGQNVSVLEAHLEQFKIIAKELEDVGGHAKGEYSSALKEAKEVLSSAFSEVKNTSLEEIRNLVQKKRDIQQEKVKEANNINIFSNFFRNLKGRKADAVERVFCEDDPISFDDEKDANEFIKRIMKIFYDINRKTIDEKIQKIESEINNVSTRLAKSIETRLMPIVSKLSDNLNKDFDVTLKVPSPRFPRIDLDLDIASTSLVRTRTRQDYYEERRWYTFFLKKHREYYTITEHTIDPKSVRNAIETGIESSVKQCFEMLDQYVATSFDKSVSDYLGDVGSVLRRMSSALDAAIASRKQDANTQEEQKKFHQALEDEFTLLVKRSCQTKEMLHAEAKC